ncbi:MAG TPA: hypothetical protein PLL30_17570 [Candidatus Krumholzibacteria bacterium]|nr:hypothetical protein [Candidatus Krumholzibacteria bacterium]HPD73587.1 hypothetical protein [Candidatus Krumholzibacteria bacterium]HRY42271.1 hypothetical protein [Candidatus Krumholzibacteria bacterium]
MATANSSSKVLSLLSAKVDLLGSLNAEIRALEKKTAEIKKQLIDSGLEQVEGKLFRASISEVVRATLEADVVRAMLTEAQIKRATKISKSTRVSLTDL